MQSAVGIVLAGGRSTRMGAPKAALPWHGSTLLRRSVGILARVLAPPIVVVRAPGQELPELPDWVLVVEDRREGRGPLQGIASGLAAVANRAPVAYVSATDLPLLHPEFVRAVTDALLAGGEALGGLSSPSGALGTGAASRQAGAAARTGAAARAEVCAPAVALPHVHGHRQPLAAAYRTWLAPLAEELVAQGAPGPASLFERVEVLELDAGALLANARLAGADPLLCSLANVNEPHEYSSLHARPEPRVTVRPVGVQVRAATLGSAACAVGVKLSQHTRVCLNGARVQADPQLPLVAGDVVSLGAGG
jgi:molybdopterin-guanine dinucleotide biosynthesis protein A